MSPVLALIKSVMGGTDAMRQAAETLLPKYPMETATAYNNRLKMNVFLNMFDMTLNSLVSRPFGTPIKVGEDVPKEIVEFLDDVNMQGDSLDRFCRNWFKDGLAKGLSHVLVEFPETASKDGLRTLKDDMDEKVRPYLVHIPPENVIFAWAQVENGKEVLKHVRIFEAVTEMVEFSEVFIEQIRVLEPGNVKIYRKNDKKKWVIHREFSTTLDFIPLVTFYADRQDFMLSKPPLKDLADLNIRHWQSMSDQIAVLTVARFPMLAASGVGAEDKVTVGPNVLLSNNDTAGRFYYVEHSGKAIEAGRKELEDLEEKMASYGATFLRQKTGNHSATARALDSAEVSSSLEDMAFGFEDSLNTAMYYVALWMKKNNGGTFQLKKNFNLSQKSESALTALLEARKLGDLSREEYLKALVLLEVLPPDFDIAANLTKRMSEKPMLPPGLPPPEPGGPQGV
jgi:hypothetical protein